MPLDNTNFPLVWMNYGHDSDRGHEEDFEAFAANLKRGVPFVILTDSAPTAEHEHGQEEKKRISLWMKQHKAELRRLVLAMIVIEPNAARRMTFKAFGVVFTKFWGYPLRLAASREEAMEISAQLLSEHARAFSR